MKAGYFFLFILLSPAFSFSTIKFIEWFPQDLTKLRQAWTGPCQTLYDNFVNKGLGQCGPVLDCLLEHGTSELRKTTIASAQVTLGLIPSLITCVGNSVPEISLLASQRPMLTLLVTIGVPGMYPAKITQYVNPYDVLDGAASKRKRMFSGREGTRRRTPVILVHYLLSLAITANNLEMSLRLGSRSVLSWGCRSWYMPTLWVLFSISTYTFAAMSCNIIRLKPPHADGKDWRRWIEGDPIEDFLSAFQRFLQVCMRVPQLRRNQVPSTRVMVLQAWASCLAVTQGILGTLILSSLIFVGFHDTLIILARFLASALVSRMIVLLQLEIIRAQVDDASTADDQVTRSPENSSHPDEIPLEHVVGSNGGATTSETN